MPTTMPKTITLPNNRTLRRLESFDSVEPEGLVFKALRYAAMDLFCDLNVDGDLDMDAIDQASAFQRGELYLNDYEGYDDATRTYYAKTMAINGCGVIAVNVWDYHDHNAWYVAES